MEVHYSPDGCQVPAGAYIAVRVGSVRKWAKYDPSVPIKFSKADPKVKVDFFQHVGAFDLTINPEINESRVCSVAGSSPGHLDLRFRLSTGPSNIGGQVSNVELPKIASATGETSNISADPEKRDNKQTRAQKYLNKHGVEGLLGGAVKALLSAEPENPQSFLTKYLGEHTVTMGSSIHSKLTEPSPRNAGKLPPLEKAMPPAPPVPPVPDPVPELEDVEPPPVAAPVAITPAKPEPNDSVSTKPQAITPAQSCLKDFEMKKYYQSSVKSCGTGFWGSLYSKFPAAKKPPAPAPSAAPVEAPAQAPASAPALAPAPAPAPAVPAPISSIAVSEIAAAASQKVELIKGDFKFKASCGNLGAPLLTPLPKVVLPVKSDPIESAQPPPAAAPEPIVEKKDDSAPQQASPSSTRPPPTDAFNIKSENFKQYYKTSFTSCPLQTWTDLHSKFPSKQPPPGSKSEAVSVPIASSSSKKPEDKEVFDKRALSVKDTFAFKASVGAWYAPQVKLPEAKQPSPPKQPEAPKQLEAGKQEIIKTKLDELKNSYQFNASVGGMMLLIA
eukprot:gnl/MRDRNA2_/MRDRNA2_32487_c0_seq1.p1 gnl/MRDRNA2_/MRDRNA2_32487_c0~~gnl/MRDRNA2_/MRDRNA2_32487_c0_seq1.p1  ORF type:complete len:557 (+),score=138.73 gnl/MRDRNA2_/MRDRNA2_32487_c0_seq1:74-1744(+)